MVNNFTTDGKMIKDIGTYYIMVHIMGKTYMHVSISSDCILVSHSVIVCMTIDEIPI